MWRCEELLVAPECDYRARRPTSEASPFAGSREGGRERGGGGGGGCQQETLSEVWESEAENVSGVHQKL